MRRALPAVRAGGARLCDGDGRRGRARLPTRSGPAFVQPSVRCSDAPHSEAWRTTDGSLALRLRRWRWRHSHSRSGLVGTRLRRLRTRTFGRSRIGFLGVRSRFPCRACSLQPGKGLGSGRWLRSRPPKAATMDRRRGSRPIGAGVISQAADLTADALGRSARPLPPKHICSRADLPRVSYGPDPVIQLSTPERHIPRFWGKSQTSPGPASPHGDTSGSGR